jgi:hypothetical protein
MAQLGDSTKSRQEGPVMAAPVHEPEVHVRELTPQEGAAIFNEAAQRYLKMSGPEFLRKWDAKEFGDDPDQPGVMDVAFLLPLVR